MQTLPDNGYDSEGANTMATNCPVSITRFFYRVNQGIYEQLRGRVEDFKGLICE